MDLGFILDASSKVTFWNSMLRFVQGMASSFDISPSKTHVGIVVFSSYGRIAFPFDADYTRDGVTRLIDSLEQQNEEGARIDHALQIAHRHLFSYRYGARTEARKV